MRRRDFFRVFFSFVLAQELWIFFLVTCRPLPYRAKFNLNLKGDTNGHRREVSRSYPPFYLL